MITSKKANEMYSSVTPMYEKSDFMQAIFEAIGSEADGSVGLGDEILRQLFPQTADSWGLILWEQRVGIVTNLNESIEKRRRKVISKLQLKYPITPKNLAMIIKSYSGSDVEIIEDVAPYTFEIRQTSYTGFPTDLKELYEIVKKTKPSHLATTYSLVSITQSAIYYGLVALMGESMTVYPWIAKNIETSAKIEIGIVQATGAENVTIYPKGGI